MKGEGEKWTVGKVAEWRQKIMLKMEITEGNERWRKKRPVILNHEDRMEDFNRKGN